MGLAISCYSLTQPFPKREEYGLTSQIRRSAVSVPSNIAEGSGRRSDRDFSRFVWIAYSSACELETQVLLSQQLGLAEVSSVSSVAVEIDEIRGMLFAFATSLEPAAN